MNDFCPPPCVRLQARGKYVHIELPGSERIVDFTVEVNMRKPLAKPGEEKIAKVCYGVQARTQTEVSPEYITTDDPDDPVFYSTCYVREKVVKWLPVEVEPPQPKPRWKFHSKCLSCDSFQQGVTEAMGPSPQEDCERVLNYTANGKTCADRIREYTTRRRRPLSDKDAKQQVAEEFPSICGPCGNGTSLRAPFWVTTNQ